MNQKASLLPRISVTRPVTVTMCLVALLVLGVVAYSRIPVKLMPSGLTPPFLYVRVNYRNATPQETEREITLPLEETLRMVKGIKRVRSYSGTYGSRAHIEFRQDTDMDLAYNDLTERLDRLKPTLPEVSRDQVRVYKHDQDAWSIMWAGVNLDSTIVDPYQYMQVHIQRPLERIDGVGRVDLWGVDQKEVMVEVDQDRMRARGVSMRALVQTLQSDNFALAGGYVKEGDKKFFVRSVARYQKLEEIQNIQIRSRTSNVRLAEVANIIYDVPLRSWYQRIDGEPAVAFGIKQDSGANIVEVCERVEKAMKEIEADPRTGGQMKFNVFFNQGFYIQQSIRNLQSTGLWGGLFAALVLFFYLRTVQMTAIITLSIPLCVMITMTALYFIGWSMNVVTMMGFMVGIGMVVDNAIVILENIYRFRGKGEAPEPAAIFGASEVGLAITMATLTTVVVFVPMMLMGSNMFMTFYLTRMGIPVIIALVGSLLVALLFIPLASVRFSGGAVKEDPGSIRWIRKIYVGALQWTMTHRRDAFIIVVILLASISYPAGNLKRGDKGGGNVNEYGIKFNMPAHFSAWDTNQIVEQVEAFLESKREIYGIRTMRVYFRSTFAYVRLYLEMDPNESWWHVAYKDLRVKLGIPVAGPMGRKEVIEDMRTHMPQFVGIRSSVDTQSGGNDPSISVYLQGEDTEVLMSLVDEAERRIRSIPSVISVDTDMERAQDEVQVSIDRERASRMGISARDVGRSIAFGLQGVKLPSYQANQREVDVRLYLDRNDRQTLDQLRNMTFATKSGEEVTLRELGTLKMAKGSGRIYRSDGNTRLRIRAFTTREDKGGLYREIDKAMSGFAVPRGYTWNKGERYSTMLEEEDTTLFGLIMAITCVFLLMGVLFESFILPFSVLFSIPLAFLGVYWTLFWTGTPMNIMAQIGLIVLIGVVVNNAIVLVDMINRLRMDGMDRFEAILEAGRNRFRPIMMTTFTTVFGLLPMAVGNSNVMGEPYAPLGRTMMGGLICSTAFTLLVVPLFYTFLDDLRLFMQRVTTGTFLQKKKGVYSGMAADD